MARDLIWLVGICGVDENGWYSKGPNWKYRIPRFHWRIWIPDAMQLHLSVYIEALEHIYISMRTSNYVWSIPFVSVSVYIGGWVFFRMYGGNKEPSSSYPFSGPNIEPYPFSSLHHCFKHQQDWKQGFHGQTKPRGTQRPSQDGSNPLKTVEMAKPGVELIPPTTNYFKYLSNF